MASPGRAARSEKAALSIHPTFLFISASQLLPPMQNTSDPSASISTDPNWDHARDLLAGIKQALRISLAGQVLLGQELCTLKKDLGFHRGNNQHGRIGQPVQSSPQTWAEYVKQELGVSYKTADRCIEMFEAAKARVKKIGVTGDLPGGAKKLALMFDSRPSTMAEDDREKLHAVVERLVSGSTQAELLEELRLVKKHVPLTGGDTSAHRKEKPSEAEMMAQLSFRFFSPVAEALQAFRTNADREVFLHTVPLHSPDDQTISLTTLERDLEASLHDVRAARKARMKQTTGTVIS